MSEAVDLLIRGGTVVDGSGAEPVDADIAIVGGRIAAVERRLSVHAAEEIDARGRVVTPGFIDIHTHYDGQAVWSDRLNPSSVHGSTTVVTGNCGVGFAPCRAADRDLLVRVMEGVEDIPGAVMSEGLSWDWESFPDYLNAVAARPHDADIAAYLPHSPLRVYAMGERGARREAATPEDLDRLRRLTREALAAGAMGFATSRLFIHRARGGDFIPTYDAAETELHAIAGALKEAGRGVLQFSLDLPAKDSAAEFAVMHRVAAASGRPASFSLGQGNSNPDEWRDMLRLVDDANAAGLSIRAQVMPRPIGMVVGLDLSVNPFCLCPSYQPLAALPLAERVAALRTPELRARLLAEAPQDPTIPLARLGRSFERMFVLGDPPDYEPPLDSSVATRAARQGVSPEALAYDLLLEQDGRAQLYVAFANYAEGNLDAVGAMLRHPAVVPGLGDGGAHYGMICDASFTTFLLSHWTRDRRNGRLPLAAAVRLLTRAPAETVGLHDRGLLRAGYKADLNIIDYDRLRLRAPRVDYDLPAGGRRLNQAADGYTATIVSGRTVYRDGEPTGALPGTLVRGPQPAPPVAA